MSRWARFLESIGKGLKVEDMPEEHRPKPREPKHVHEWGEPELQTVHWRTMQPTQYARTCKTCGTREHQKVTYKTIYGEWIDYSKLEF